MSVFKNVILARNSVAPEDDLRIEICWSDFRNESVSVFKNVTLARNSVAP